MKTKSHLDDSFVVVRLVVRDIFVIRVYEFGKAYPFLSMAERRNAYFPIRQIVLGFNGLYALLPHFIGTALARYAVRGRIGRGERKTGDKQALAAFLRYG